MHLNLLLRCVRHCERLGDELVFGTEYLLVLSARAAIDASQSIYTCLLLHVEFCATERGAQLVWTAWMLLLFCQLCCAIEGYLGRLHFCKFATV